MQKELEMWQLENRKHGEALQQEERCVCVGAGIAAS
jgi:hypothetical protein